MSKSVGRGCAPSSSAHVRSTARRDRWGEHGAPVQGRRLRSLLYLGDAEELYQACYPNLISDPTAHRSTVPDKAMTKVSPDSLI
jgi:hypothetical protein